MRQTVTVTREYVHGFIEVELTRVSACGDKCASCGAKNSCGPQETVRVMAKGGEGAKLGGKVEIESRSGQILGLAALVYLMPLALFFAGFAFGTLYGGLGFALGVGLLAPVNKIVGRRVLYVVISTIKEDDPLPDEAEAIARAAEARQRGDMLTMADIDLN
jgi:sigma-E factor negative regulatory protein RseC